MRSGATFSAMMLVLGAACSSEPGTSVTPGRTIEEPAGTGGAPDQGTGGTTGGSIITSAGGIISSAGGIAPTGGTTATGGSTSSQGGTTASGGSMTTTGGTAVTGGTSATGGTQATGGQGGGGTSATGGKVSTGGKAATGGSASGGAQATGGAMPMGGNGGASQGGQAGSPSGGSGGSGPTMELAQGKSVTADTEETANPATNAVDGDVMTRFCPADGETGHTWVVDLGASHSLSEISITWEFDGRVYGYTVEVSSDGNSYQMLLDRSSNTATTQTQTANVSGSGRYVRITVTSLPTDPITWGCFTEVEVYGS